MRVGLGDDVIEEQRFRKRYPDDCQPDAFVHAGCPCLANSATLSAGAAPFGRYVGEADGRIGPAALCLLLWSLFLAEDNLLRRDADIAVRMVEPATALPRERAADAARMRAAARLAADQAAEYLLDLARGQRVRCERGPNGRADAILRRGTR